MRRPQEALLRQGERFGDVWHKIVLTKGEGYAMILCVFKRRRLLSGEMSEWLKEPVLKTGGAQVPVGSNPTLSANFYNCITIRGSTQVAEGAPLLRE